MTSVIKEYPLKYQLIAQSFDCDTNTLDIWVIGRFHTLFDARSYCDYLNSQSDEDVAFIVLRD